MRGLVDRRLSVSALLFVIVMAIAALVSQSAFAVPAGMTATIGLEQLADGVDAVTCATDHCLNHDSQGHSGKAAGIWSPRVERLRPNLAQGLVYVLTRALFRPPRDHA